MTTVRQPVKTVMPNGVFYKIFLDDVGDRHAILQLPLGSFANHDKEDVVEAIENHWIAKCAAEDALKEAAELDRSLHVTSTSGKDLRI